ncbi:MAG TPA: hypothetical protein VG013_04950 [Gemmataceae bacterium]|jgi:hypothetical protein|nr:hypothetical protein [Gemmataceae bacterium]
MSDSVSFLCPGCKSRLRASARFTRQSCPCPRCGRQVVLPPLKPADELPVLVLDDGRRLPRLR